jgi:oxygen-independent coproporphyrinogen-3 oxidase
MAGIYLHIPFCKQACHYCDFHFSTDARGAEEMVEAMEGELDLRKDFLSTEVETLYWGGGTPSLLPVELLERLMSKVRERFTVAPGAEVTLEANPDDLDPSKLRQLRVAGVNRLSLGLQSFNADLLRFLNRAHDAASARRCITMSREAGIANLSVDLIYGIPGLTPETWRETLQEVLQQKPEHLSAYSLTIEERTVFGSRLKKGQFAPAPEADVAGQFETMVDVLEENGYEHYEISNFSLPGFQSRHNSNYWKQVPYLGIGPSAHSYDGMRRYMNIRNNARYVRSIADGVLPMESEVLTRENKINEYILTRIRTSWGCDLGYLRVAFADNLSERCAAVLERYEGLGLLARKNDVLRLTRKGKLLADQITEDLMI